MNAIRFIPFTQMVDTTQKCIKRIEASFAPSFGIKSVHIFWLHELNQNPNGLTATELANRRMVDRSLISREMDDLKQQGLVEAQASGKKNYNTRLTLTDKGREMAKRIDEAAFSIQQETSGHISEEELVGFYTTFEKLRDRLITIATNLNEKKEKEYEQ